MSYPAVRLANELLKHHRRYRRDSKSVNQKAVEKTIITYKDLAQRAKTAWRGIGRPLGEIAEWCDDEGWPPLNALAVNGKTREPGPEYDGAANCHSASWCMDVRAVISFKGYPPKVS